MRTAIFDLDGTLVDTSADMIAAANAVLGQSVLDPKLHAAVAFAGGRAMLRKGSQLMGDPWDDHRIDAVYSEFLQVYASDLSGRSRAYPGAREGIEALVRQGWRVGICTNKPEGLADQLMRDLNWRSEFAALVGADTLPVRKPDPAPVLETVRRLGGDAKCAVMIGDTNGDIEAAARAKMKSILVRFDVDPHRSSQIVPDAICNDFKSVLGVLDALFPEA